MTIGSWKTTPRPEEEPRVEAEVLVDLRQELHVLAPERPQEAEGEGEEVEVAEGRAADEEEAAEEDEGIRVALLVRVEAGGDEGPHLPQDVGRGHEDAHEEDHLHVEEERLRGAGEDELDLGERGAQRAGQEVEDLDAPVPAQGEADAEGDRRVDEAHAQLLEVLEERHLVGVRTGHSEGSALLPLVRQGTSAHGVGRGSLGASSGAGSGDP